MHLRQQLPVYSPLEFRDILNALGRSDDRDELKQKIIDAYGAKDALLTDSGTSALGLALKIAKQRRPNGFCLLPSFGCYDLATAALAAEIPVAFYDIDPQTFAPQLNSVPKEAKERCAALVLVHHFGICTDPEPVLQFARSIDAIVIEDAAQANGACWLGNRVGTNGDFGILSFGRGKGVTGGGGGALLINNDLLSSYLLIVTKSITGIPGNNIASHAVKLIVQWLLARPSMYGLPSSIPALGLGTTVFHPPSAPRDMIPGTARILNRTRWFPDGELETRRTNAVKIDEIIRRSRPDQLIVIDERGKPGWLRYPILLGEVSQKQAERGNRLGVMRSYPISLIDLPQIRPLLCYTQNLANGRDLARGLWTIPTHSLVRDDEYRLIEHWIRSLT